MVRSDAISCWKKEIKSSKCYLSFQKSFFSYSSQHLIHFLPRWITFKIFSPKSIFASQLSILLKYHFSSVWPQWVWIWPYVWIFLLLNPRHSVSFCRAWGKCIIFVINIPIPNVKKKSFLERLCGGFNEVIQKRN